MPEQNKGFDWSLLGSWEGWKQPGTVGPNAQDLFAGMAKAVNPNGVTGQVGGAFQNYLQSIAAQKAFAAQMKQRQDFAALMSQLLGLGGQKLNLGGITPEQHKTMQGDRLGIGSIF